MSTGISLFSSLWILGVQLAITLPAMAADIYFSSDASGVVRWSTQALDDSYHLVASGNGLPPAARKEVRPIQSKVQEGIASKLAQRRFVLSPLVEIAARRAGIDFDMVMALIEVESDFDTHAVSVRGARGLMQLMPKTAAGYGMRDVRELHDPEKNLHFGTRHLKSLLTMYDGQWSLALASYNSGQGTVSKHGLRIPRNAETMLYVPAVLAKASRTPLITRNQWTTFRSSVE